MPDRSLADGSLPDGVLPDGSVLVVGATGILRPAVLSLVREGRPVIAVARRAGPLAELASAVDVTTRAVDVGIGELDLDADRAVVYAPDADDDALDRLQQHVSGRFVRILTSAWSAPGAPDPPARPDRVHLRLGWHRDAAAVRWHTPAEVSAAALSALRTGRDGQLGRIAPWNDRPV